MLAGMGTVFVFLTVLVTAMSLLAALVKRFQSEPQDIVDDEIAAIAAAIREHRSR
jgi:Na+-transporting methylmalonyl-CoA/oxaloacetate decarboxylase gamma subunit